MKEIQIFSHEMFGDIRTMTNEKGETYFVGKDVAEALGYSDPQKALKMHVDNEDKLTRQIVVSGQRRNIIFINESGLYALVLSSKLPTAKQRHFVYYSLMGERKHREYLMWTAEGVRYLLIMGSVLLIIFYVENLDVRE